MFVIYQHQTSTNHALHYLIAALQLHQITVELRSYGHQLACVQTITKL